jgi:hypothetical protein
MNGEPLGSPYKTILDGENKTQTVIINGFAKSKSVKIKGLTVQNGYSESNGGGIYSKNLSFKIEESIIQNNTAKESGAGIYSGGGIQDLHMILIEGNVGKSAFYIEGIDDDSIRAERAIISQNSGNGLEVKNLVISFVNSVFYGNKTAISVQSSEFDLIHCTVTKNETGIMSENSAVKVVNTILWNDEKELEGDGFVVEYSCVNGGYAGEGNINNDPLFVNAGSPKGNDGVWGTVDDGLRLERGSPCIDAGKETGIFVDISETTRPLSNSFDMGAYEIAILQAGEDIIDYGILTSDNEFVHREDIGDIAVGLTRRDLYKKDYTKSALTFRVFVEKNKYTDINSKTAKVIFRDENGKDVGNGIFVEFYRNKKLETSSHYAFTSRIVENGKIKGDVIFFVIGDVFVKPEDPFKTLKIADNVSDGQEYIPGAIHIIVSN